MIDMTPCPTCGESKDICMSYHMPCSVRMANQRRTNIIKEAAYDCDLHLGFRGRMIHVGKSEHYERQLERRTLSLSPSEDVMVVISLKDLSTMLGKGKS